jgi:hypothetical protein
MKEDQAFQDYLKALHEITIELTTIHDLDTFYKRAIELGLQRLGFDRLGLLLYDQEQTRMLRASLCPSIIYALIHRASPAS